MDLIVTAKKFGTYSKGDILKDVPASTAKGLLGSGKLKENKAEVKKAKSKK